MKHVARFRGWHRLLVLVLLLSVFPFRMASAAYTAASMTRSYYVSSTSTSALDHVGCESGQMKRTGDMTLFFGSPVKVGTTYGVTMWGATDQTTTGVSNLVKAFIGGYRRCATGSIFLWVHVGVSNCLLGTEASATTCDSTSTYKTATWVRAHGKAWGQMLNALNGWITANHYDDRALVQGAWDLEPAYSSYAKAEAWMNGYDIDAGGPGIYVHASADGCPYTTALNSSTNGSCANGWTQAALWHETWEHVPAYPYPQIYTTNGTMAKQWLRIAEYAYHAKGSSMNFVGVMSQYAACACGSSTNTNKQAYDQLLGQLNSHSHTAQGDIYSYTDMRGFTLHDH